MILITYTGSALSGITTNLEKIIERAKENNKIQTTFNFSLGNIKGYDVLEFRGKLNVLETSLKELNQSEINLLRPPLFGYRWPSPQEEQIARKEIYQKSNGIIFVVDSLLSSLDKSFQAWEELIKHISPRREIPLIVQYNKRDHLQAADIAFLKRKFNPDRKFPEFEASAVMDKGVWETFTTTLERIAVHLRREKNSKA